MVLESVNYPADLVETVRSHSLLAFEPAVQQGLVVLVVVGDVPFCGVSPFLGGTHLVGPGGVVNYGLAVQVVADRFQRVLVKIAFGDVADCVVAVATPAPGADADKRSKCAKCGFSDIHYYML